MGRARFNPTLILAIAVLIMAMGGTAFAASAVSRVVVQSGSGSQTALVNSQGQLSTVAIAPSQFFYRSFGVNVGCSKMYVVPKGKKLVINDLYFIVYAEGSNFPVTVHLKVGACTMAGATGLLATSYQRFSASSMHLTEGFIVPSGATVYIDSDHASGIVDIDGYFIPAS